MRRAIAALAVAAGALVAASATGAKDEPLGASVCGAFGCTAVGPDDALSLLRALWQLPLGAAPARPAPFFRISFVYPQDSPFPVSPAYFVPDSGALRVRDAETIGRWSAAPPELIARLSALTATLRPFALPRVTRAEGPRLLEYRWGDNDIRWQLEPLGDGTRLTLWHNIDRGFVAMGAAGWHICLDVLERLLANDPIGRIVGGEAMKFGWPRLHTEYAKRFGVEPQSWPPKAPQS